MVGSISHFSAFCFLLLSLPACTTPLTQRAWIELRSENFSILTSLPRERAFALLEELELFRASVPIVSNLRRIEPRVPTEITVFASERDFAPFRPSTGIAGYFAPGLRRNQVALQAGSASGIDPTAVIFHEYTHFLLRNEQQDPYPLWFEEGMAELLGALHIDGDKIRVGVVPEHRDTVTETLPYATLLESHDLNGLSLAEAHSFYAYSWLVVHYLTLGRPKEEGVFSEQMNRYRKLLMDEFDGEQAFAQGFGMGYAELSRRISRYRRHPDPGWWFSRDLVSLDLDPSIRTPPRAEVAARLAQLALDAGRTESAAALVDEAIATDAGNALAWSELARLHALRREWDAAEAAHQRAIGLAPSDPAIHLDFAIYLQQRSDVDPADRAGRASQARQHCLRAIELAPRTPEGWALLGATYLEDEGDPSPGIEALERARGLLPSHPVLQLWLAALYHRARDDQRAADLARRALAWSHEQPELAEAARDLLQSIERPTATLP